MRVIRKIRRTDRILKDLWDEWRIAWRLKKRDKIVIGDYFGM